MCGFPVAELYTMFYGQQHNGNAFDVNKQTSGYRLDDFKTSNAPGYIKKNKKDIYN